MTDLERLKGMYQMRPEEQGWHIIDAHLKEDAEYRQAKELWLVRYAAEQEKREEDLRAELVRLREERSKLHALYNRAQDDASREAEIRVNQGLELDRLREELRSKRCGCAFCKAES